MTTETLKVEGMSCGHCAQAVENAVKKLGAEAKVDLAGKTAAVSFDEKKLALEAIKDAIRAQGYKVL